MLSKFKTCFGKHKHLTLFNRFFQALKEEIGLLSRKGGHILPPAQPPLGQENEVM